ncbi:mechanosensitive ion channel domain-containing protein [Nitrosomonas marina]|uniref:Mechanosensitive ion channel n=1 Tax=Nitrosomonas marina TaxID=917 RepID=A0A1H8BTE3_9PROT|nr:mechanosensitive ion channel domain-containing protein [Nitrosomonas marina]SEM85414.1 Mechanosensitive ion channel [Nitrosomonas marina]
MNTTFAASILSLMCVASPLYADQLADIIADKAESEQDAASQRVILKTLHSIEGVLNDPQPMVTIEKLGDSSIVLRIYGWTNQEIYSFPNVRSEAIRQIKQDLIRKTL